MLRSLRKCSHACFLVFKFELSEFLAARIVDWPSSSTMISRHAMLSLLFVWLQVLLQISNHERLYSLFSPRFSFNMVRMMQE